MVYGNKRGMPAGLTDRHGFRVLFLILMVNRTGLLGARDLCPCILSSLQAPSRSEMFVGGRSRGRSRPFNTWQIAML